VERCQLQRYATTFARNGAQPQSLTGEISSSLGNLTFLNTLDLSNNNFRGPVPPIRNMQQLQTFYLYNNFLDGTIPADAFKKKKKKKKHN
jgi:hypothetical protein